MGTPEEKGQEKVLLSRGTGLVIGQEIGRRVVERQCDGLHITINSESTYRRTQKVVLTANWSPPPSLSCIAYRQQGVSVMCSVWMWWKECSWVDGLENGEYNLEGNYVG